MNTPLNDELKSLLAAALEGTLAPQEFEKLQERLKSDPVFRQIYIDHALLDAHLADEFNTDSIRGMVDMISSDSPNEKRKKSFLTSKGWRFLRLGGIAAGIVFAILTTSATIAYALPINGPRIIHVENFCNSGFEISANTSDGFPKTVGRWSGDDSEISQLGSQAREGTRAIAFNKAKANQNTFQGSSNYCDIFQIVDLRPYRTVIEGKEVLLEFSVDFMDTRISGESLWHMNKIYLFEGNAERIHVDWPANLTECVGSSMDHFSSKGSTSPEWKTITSRCVIPRMADFAVLQIAVGNLPHERRTASPDLGKQYADNARLNLVVRPQTSAR